MAFMEEGDRERNGNEQTTRLLSLGLFKRKCVYVEEILLFNKFSQVSIHALTTKIYVVAQQSFVMVGRWWIFSEFLWPPYGTEQAIIFLPWFLCFFFSSVNFNWSTSW